jgi:hypothetical protein
MKNTTYELSNKYEILNLIRASFKKLHPGETFVEPTFYNDTKTWNPSTKRYEDWGHSCKFMPKHAKFNDIWFDTVDKGEKLGIKMKLAGDYRYMDSYGRTLKRPVPAVSKGIRIYR